MGFGVFFCVHDAAATQGLYLSLILLPILLYFLTTDNTTISKSRCRIWTTQAS